MAPTVSGVVRDASGNEAAWSASWSVAAAAPRVLWGACPHNGASEGSVQTKHGSKAGSRIFRQTQAAAPLPRPAAAGFMHYSFKREFTEAEIVTLCQNFLEGQVNILTIFHEHNNDADAVDKAARITTFHRRLKARRDAGDIPSSVRSCVVQTGWAHDDRSTQQPVYAEGDYTGTDFDGIASTDNQPADSHRGLYYDFYNHEYAETVSWMQSREYQGWCIPELGTTRHSTDPNSVWRVESMQIQADKINNAPIKPVFAAWFDYSNLPSTTAHVECYEKANEIAFIQSLVANNP